MLSRIERSASGSRNEDNAGIPTAKSQRKRTSLPPSASVTAQEPLNSLRLPSTRSKTIVPASGSRRSSSTQRIEPPRKLTFQVVRSVCSSTFSISIELMDGASSA
jgi:hypothetical protein